MACASETPGEWKEKLRCLLELADALCQQCQELKHITGINKLLKRCQAERKFLINLEERRVAGRIKATHLASSNLSHLQGIVKAASSLPDVSQVLQSFAVPDNPNPLVVDVVCNDGYSWIKIIARKAQALHLIWAGAGQFGDRCITHQARLYNQCAQIHSVNFTAPQIVFVFHAGITRPLYDALQSLSVVVEGEVLEVDNGTEIQLTQGDRSAEGLSIDGSDDDDRPLQTASEYIRGTCNARTSHEPSSSSHTHLAKSSDSMKEDKSTLTPSLLLHQCHITSSPETGSDASSEPTDKKTKEAKLVTSNDSLMTTFSVPTQLPCILNVNLDVSTLICLSSNVCNGRCQFVFQDKILNHQAKEERRKPLLPSLNNFLQGKNKLMCKTAHAIFKSILDTVGGACEQKRAEKILESVTVVPDQPSTRTIGITPSAKSSERAKVIFGTGDSIQAITVTANAGFVRSAAHQGVNFAVWVHDSRALTEQKESSAQHYFPDAD